MCWAKIQPTAAPCMPMSISEPTVSLAAIKYTDVDWSSFSAVEGHPLRYLFNRGFPLYIKINRLTHVAYTYRYIYRPTRLVGKPLPEVAVGVDLPAIGFDERLVFLQVGDESVHDILLTGSRDLDLFEAGGLALPSISMSTGSEPIELVDIDFAKCVLVNRARYRAAQDSSIYPLTALDGDLVDFLRIGFDDLYLMVVDLEAIRQLKGGVGVERQAYPLGGDGRKLPMAINWTYQAAVAAYQLGEVEPRDKALLNWLRGYAPDDVMRKRWVNTAVNLVKRDYKFAGKFGTEKIAEYRTAAEVQALGLSPQLTSALVVTEWWMDQLDDDKDSKVLELAGRLEDVGFQGIAVRDLTGMIKGDAIEDSGYSEFRDALNKYQSKKDRDRLKSQSKQMLGGTSDTHQSSSLDLGSLGGAGDAAVPCETPSSKSISEIPSVLTYKL